MQTFTSLVAIIFINLINTNYSFLIYPFNGGDLVQKFLDTLAPKAELFYIRDLRDNLMDHAVDGAKCVRKCQTSDVKVCYFNFTLRHYQVMGGSCPECNSENLMSCHKKECVIADGIPRGFLSLNFQLPGPKIEVCRNDIVVVDLHNQAEGLSTSLHWHGIRQHGTQFMDGVPYLTQCPIPFGESFRYSFRVEDEGTHLYHSHAGNQKTDGVFGALIVRGIDAENPNILTYDFDLPEYTILMNDWMHQSADDYMPGYEKRSLLSQSVLVNGHGRFFNQSTNTSTAAPLTSFHLEAGKKYRFRLINAASNVCPFIFQIEDHNFTIIATEVSYVKPTVIDTLYLLAGERFDFVLDTKNKEIRNYWLRFKQLSPCQQQLQGFAILKYQNEKVKDDLRTSVDLNSRTPPTFNQLYPQNFLLNSPKPGEEGYAITYLKDFRHNHNLTHGDAEQTKFLFFDTPGIPNDFVYTEHVMGKYMFTTDASGKSFIGTANNISFEFPSFPLLLEPELINHETFCDVNNIPEHRCVFHENKKICRCTHRIKFALGSVAELIIVNVEDRISHPIHFHGHKFHVVDSGLLRENMTVDEVMRPGTIPKHKKYMFPPYKDTVVLPFPGYVRLRFRANNPGFWLLHCHFDWHLPIGMSVIVQVGELDQMRKPSNDFPRCRNFLPKGIV